MVASFGYAQGRRYDDPGRAVAFHSALIVEQSAIAGARWLEPPAALSSCVELCAAVHASHIRERSERAQGIVRVDFSCIEANGAET